MLLDKTKNLPVIAGLFIMDTVLYAFSDPPA